MPSSEAASETQIGLPKAASSAGTSTENEETGQGAPAAAGARAEELSSEAESTSQEKKDSDDSSAGDPSKMKARNDVGSIEEAEPAAKKRRLLEPVELNSGSDTKPQPKTTSGQPDTSSKNHGECITFHTCDVCKSLLSCLTSSNHLNISTFMYTFILRQKL